MSKDTTKNPRYFAGYRDGVFTVFRARTIPTWESHGDRNNFCYGPYQTRQAIVGNINRFHSWAEVS